MRCAEDYRPRAVGLAAPDGRRWPAAAFVKYIESYRSVRLGVLEPIAACISSLLFSGFTTDGWSVLVAC